MNVPNAEAAVVVAEKITDYLLNLRHPDGAGKAQFFSSLGFRIDDWQRLAAALLEIVRTNDVTTSVESRHGQKYIVDGELETPSGRSPTVRTVWIIDAGGSVPRLITAYPHVEE